MHKIIIQATLVFILFAVVGCSLKQNNTMAPSDQNATIETITTLNRLNALRSKGIMLGHEDALAYGIG